MYLILAEKIAAIFTVLCICVFMNSENDEKWRWNYYAKRGHKKRAGLADKGQLASRVVVILEQEETNLFRHVPINLPGLHLYTSKTLLGLLVMSKGTLLLTSCSVCHPDSSFESLMGSMAK